MSISMHSASVPIFVHMLGNLATGWTRPRLPPRRGSSTRRCCSACAWRPTCCRSLKQIQIACDTAKFGVARLAGVEAPKFDDNEATLAELRERVRKTVDYRAVGAGSADRRQRGARDHRAAARRPLAA